MAPLTGMRRLIIGLPAMVGLSVLAGHLLWQLLQSCRLVLSADANVHQRRAISQPRKSTQLDLACCIVRREKRRALKRAAALCC
jgi:hypothetical protein